MSGDTVLQWSTGGLSLAFAMPPRAMGASLVADGTCLFAAGGWPSKPQAVVALPSAPTSRPDPTQALNTLPAGSLTERFPRLALGGGDPATPSVDPDRMLGGFTISRLELFPEDDTLTASLAATATLEGSFGASSPAAGAGAASPQVPALDFGRLGATGTSAATASPRRLTSQSMIVTKAEDRAGHVGVACPLSRHIVYFGGESVVFGSSGHLLADMVVLNTKTSGCHHLTQALCQEAADAERAAKVPTPAATTHTKKTPASKAKTQAPPSARTVEWPAARRYASACTVRVPSRTVAEEAQVSARVAKAAAEAKARVPSSRAGRLPPKSSTPRSAGPPTAEAVVMFSGEGDAGLLADMWLFRLDAMQWVQLETFGTPPTPRKYHTMTPVGNGSAVMVFGGHDGSSRLNDVHIFTMESRTWTQVPMGGLVPPPRCMHAACVPHESLQVEALLEPLPEADVDADEEVAAVDSKIKSNTAVDLAPVPSDVVLVHGGNTDDGVDGALLACNLGTRKWQLLLQDGTAPPRYGHCLLPMSTPAGVGLPFTARSHTSFDMVRKAPRPRPLESPGLHPASLPGAGRSLGYRLPAHTASSAVQHHVGVPLDLRELTSTFSVELEALMPDTFRQVSAREDSKLGEEPSKVDTEASEAEAKTKASASRKLPPKSARGSKSARSKSPTKGKGKGKGKPKKKRSASPKKKRAASPSKRRSPSPTRTPRSMASPSPPKAVASSPASPSIASLAPPLGWQRMFLLFGGRDVDGPNLQPFELRVLDDDAEADAKSVLSGWDDGTGDGLTSGRVRSPGWVDYPEGRYRGTMLDGHMDGTGEWLGTDGTQYNGGFAEDAKNGHGQLTLPNGSVYTGNFVDGQFEGKGRLVAADMSPVSPRPTPRGVAGVTVGVALTTPRPATALYDAGEARGIDFKEDLAEYEGEWHRGAWHGAGVATFRDGSSFTGEWLNGLPHGPGQYKLADGCGWSGSWVKGVLNGNGTRWCADGEVYKGAFEDGMRHGAGVCEYADGSRYEGSWRQNKRNGNGKCRFANQVVYKGKWVNDLPNGQGLCRYPKGDVYRGNFRNSQREGTGKYESTNGTTYDGEWHCDLRHGKGMETQADGRQVQGLWIKDSFSVMTFE